MMQNVCSLVNEMYVQQADSWELFSRNIGLLKNVQTRTLHFDGFSYVLQFNPERIVSTKAKVDAKTLAERRCFLCRTNRPAEQLMVEYDDFEVLCNPFPIFNQHFTISTKEHVPQQITSYFGKLLVFAEILTGYTIVYNGPHAGASAPDHMHFQCGEFGFMPLDKEFAQIKNRYGKSLFLSAGLQISGVDDGLRKMIAIESADPVSITSTLESIFSILQQNTDTSEEPKMNIHGLFANGVFRILLFLRQQHRPRQYYLEGDENIFLSPGAVDYGSLLVIPLEKDFLKITKEDISDIFGQISTDSTTFVAICDQIHKYFHRIGNP